MLIIICISGHKYCQHLWWCHHVRCTPQEKGLPGCIGRGSGGVSLGDWVLCFSWIVWGTICGFWQVLPWWCHSYPALWWQWRWWRLIDDVFQELHQEAEWIRWGLCVCWCYPKLILLAQIKGRCFQPIPCETSLMPVPFIPSIQLVCCLICGRCCSELKKGYSSNWLKNMPK